MLCMSYFDMAGAAEPYLQRTRANILYIWLASTALGIAVHQTAAIVLELYTLPVYASENL
jgi:hypothetical protein